MPNRNYIAGVKKERKLVNEARDIGCIAFRSAGSHSPIDVCIINLETKVIHFIQCKPESMSNKKKTELADTLSELNGTFSVSFKVQ